MILVTSDQMRQFDKHTIQSRYVPGIVLMEHAGKAVADIVSQHDRGRVCVLCGKGNNGGDGWIAARWLKRRGFDVMVYSTVVPNSLVGDARQAFTMAEALGVPFVVLEDTVSNSASGQHQDSEPQEDQAVPVLLPEADIYVDALLGTGTTRPLQGHLKRLVDAVNNRDGWVVAVDVPTGLNATTGEVQGSCVRADLTLCIGAQKLGTAVSPGCYYAGEVQVADIGIDVPSLARNGQGSLSGNPLRGSLGDTSQGSLRHPEIDRLGSLSVGHDSDGGLATVGELAEAIDLQWALQRWPKRHPSSHKGTFGKVAVAVGAMKGAPILAGMGAARVGAGLVVMARTDSELTPLAQVPLEFVSRHSVREISDVGDCSAVVVGPGLGSNAPDWVSLLREWHGVGVIDADALLPALADGPLNNKWVLTPHPKECARLLGWTTQEVQERRAEAVQLLADGSQCVVVLKGYHSLIASPDSPLLVNLSGNEALATAGTGDVLAGVIGGLLAQGLSPRDAAGLGAWLHGRAGELAGQRLSTVSVLASDVVENISRAICLHFDN